MAASLYQLGVVWRNKAELQRIALRDASDSITASLRLRLVMATEKQAEKHFRNALRIRESKLTPNHPLVSATLFRLASICHQQQRYAEAGSLFERALKINRDKFGYEHPYAARILGQMANLYRDQGLEAKAESTYLLALKTGEASLKSDHPSLIGLLGDFASHYSRSGRPDKARTLLTRSLDIAESSIARNLGSGSERQKLLYLSTFNRILDQFVGLDERQTPNGGGYGDLPFLALLRLKGRGLDEMVDRLSVLRTRAIGTDRELLGKLQTICSELSALAWRDPDPEGMVNRERLRERELALEHEREAVEDELSRSDILQRLRPKSVSVADIRKYLADSPDETAIVEYVNWHENPKTAKSYNLRHYVAYVLSANGAPQRIDLGNASRIDSLVLRLRSALGNKNTPQTLVTQLSRRLDQLILQPVRASLAPGARRLLISPEGELNLIPFAALVDERGEYLVRHYSITYLTSSRDLARLDSKKEGSSPPLLIGNPDFGRMSDEGASIDIIARRGIPGSRTCDLTGISFARLPEAGREVAAIRELLPGATILSGPDATTTALRNVRGPSILHLATHGFFLCEGRIKNPLLRSGLAMAGFNEHGKGRENGALMALDVAGLDLEGTKLAILSACETGLGEVKSSEGVHGLRRALVLAGSESQITSLWEVSTYYTRILMTDYYKTLLGPRKTGRGEALREVQIKMLDSAQHSHPFFWAGFIHSGEWANLDGQR